MGEVYELVGADKPKVYVIAHDQQDARDWGRRNRPGYYVKFASTSSPGPARGLYLKDETVYVLHAMTQEVRDAWLATGARLVYL